MPIREAEPGRVKCPINDFAALKGFLSCKQECQTVPNVEERDEEPGLTIEGGVCVFVDNDEIFPPQGVINRQREPKYRLLPGVITIEHLLGLREV